MELLAFAFTIAAVTAIGFRVRWEKRKGREEPRNSSAVGGWFGGF